MTTLDAHAASHYHALTHTNMGTDVTVRAIRSEDKYAILDLYPTLSPRTLYMRFFRVIDAPNLEEISRYTDIDFATQLAFVIELGPSKQLVAAGRLIRATEQSKVAELSCLVVDDYQNKGIGSVLVRELFEQGRYWGVEQVIALVHSENHPMLRLLKSQGYPCEMLYDEGEFTVTLDIHHEPSSDNRFSYRSSLGAMHQGI
ncbi:GNAT family N-acetyltransferase [Ferrimonas aestuarii]|uniref:GNAT family N-acetyltransferase n=1 Tax=Ferrimonas aestuarii TaxID=2569539 RepID=A0A4U1BMJ9_9GAMM|nr:GNAT family N-acetyltransferase [Ferrimonas aestuarii]TKB52781.1 GNAT family N-acetyltransferase [Ferrimonas aestuarii]